MEQEATALAANRLLPMILEKRRDHIYTTWRQANDPVLREQQWHALRQLDELAGAIEDGVREYGGSRSD
jgi:hypothetical protein